MDGRVTSGHHILFHGMEQIPTMFVPQQSLNTLVGDVITGSDKFADFVAGPNPRYLFAIPSESERVVKYDVNTGTFTEIGINLGGGNKYERGVLAKDGCIYCMPQIAKHVLMINTVNDDVERLTNVTLPEGGDELWMSGALAADDPIYCMPYHAHRILKFNPATKTAETVGPDLGDGKYKYRDTVVGADGWVYGIPFEATRIIKFDPNSQDIVSPVGDDYWKDFECRGGVLAHDECIYSANTDGRILIIETTRGSNKYHWIGESLHTGDQWGWGNATIGADSSIYWPPDDANQVLKFNINSQP